MCGASSTEEPMMPSSQSRKEAPEQTPPPTAKSLRIGSWNVRTLYEAGKIAQVCQEMRRTHLHILGVSETHLNQSGQKQLKDGELFIYSGYGEDGPHREGVGMIINKTVQKTFRGWEAHGPRIIMASFGTKQQTKEKKAGQKIINLNIIQVYAPTNDAMDEDKDNFYNRLQNVMDKLPTKDVNIVMGDFNAKVGSDNSNYEDIMGKHGLGEANDNGERFLAFCSFNSLVIGGTVFPHKRIHKATWVSPDGNTENQIDHLCISRRFRRSLQDTRVLRGADAASDHHLVLGKFRLRLKKYTQMNAGSRQKYHVNLFKDPAKKNEFKIELKNRFQALEELEEADVDHHWDMIKETINSICKEVIGPKMTNNKEWISKNSLNKIKARRELKAKVNNCRTRAGKLAAQEEYSKANKEVKNSIKKDKNTYMEELAEKAEKAAADGHLRLVYQTTKTLSGKFSKPTLPVKDAVGNSIFDPAGQLNRWQEHFQTLLNRPPPDNRPEILPARRDLPMNTEPPTRKEIAAAIKALKENKAAGPDQIPPEAMKADTETSVDMLHALFNKIWKTEVIPKEWKEGHLIKLPKKGDLSNCNNYRGISLLSIPGKVFNRVILERMKQATDDKLRDNQAGFRKNRSCTDQIASLRIIIEQSIEWRSPLLVNFIDYEKAFDSLDRESLWKLMRHYGIPDKLVKLVKATYDGTNCQVFHEGQLSRPFPIETGVRQGCLLSPFLFILAIDWIMKETTKGRMNGLQWTPWQQLEDLDFADDLALLSHTHAQMQGKTEELNNISKSVGLRIHPGKSKLMKIGMVSENPVSVEHRPLEEVDTFTYLGSTMDKQGGSEADVKARTAKARASFNQLSKVWKASNISLRTKLRLFNSNVKSVLLYGCETWKTTKAVLNRAQTFINKCLRSILKLKWQDKTRNEELWKRTGQKPIEEEIGRRKWRWIGHTLRKPSSNITRQSLQWNPQGKRKRGRPQETWKRCMDKELAAKGLTWSELSRTAQDREKWKLLVRGLYPSKG